MAILVLLLAPFVVWQITSDAVHVPLGIGYALILLLVVVHYVRDFRRQTVANRVNPITWANAKWAKNIPPAIYAHQLNMAVQLQGWRVLSCTVDDSARVELIAKKDRWTVALLCIGPDQPAATPADTDRLAVLKRETRATHIALVTTAPGDRSSFAQPLSTSLSLLRFDDLARLEDSIGLRI